MLAGIFINDWIEDEGGHENLAAHGAWCHWKLIGVWETLGVDGDAPWLQEVLTDELHEVEVSVGNQHARRHKPMAQPLHRPVRRGEIDLEVCDIGVPLRPDIELDRHIAECLW